MNNSATSNQYGDYPSFIEIYRQFYVPLINYARVKTGDIHASEDLVQEIFADVYLNRGIDSNIEGYLFTSLKRRILNYWRHENVKSKFRSEKQQTENENSFPKKVELKDIMKDLYAHVGNLSPQCQRVFHLKKAEYSNKEIAAHLNISVKTVEAHFTKALSYLRKNIDYPFIILMYLSLV